MEFIQIDPKKSLELAIEARNSAEKLIICGSAETVAYLQESMEYGDMTEAQIASTAAEIDIAQWFKAKELEIQEELSELTGEWPESISGQMSFTMATDILTGELLETVYGARIQAKDSSEVLIKFNYGGWNDCPSTEEQAALWKYWEGKYGAKIVGVGHDVIEAYVENPPTTREEALHLAFEHYFYCYDIVEQGCETISNLVAGLLNSRVWFFWWD